MMLRKWILHSVGMLAVATMLLGTPGNANEWAGPRLSQPTIPYKPGYGSGQAGGGDHFVGAWLHGCSCRRPGERNPVCYRRADSGVYGNTSFNANNSSQSMQVNQPSTIQTNVAGK